MNTKTISVEVRLSCMVVDVKGCLERQRHWGTSFYMLEPCIWHGQDGKEVPRCLLTEDSPPIGHRIVSQRQSPYG